MICVNGDVEEKGMKLAWMLIEIGYEFSFGNTHTQTHTQPPPPQPKNPQTNK